MIEKIRPLSKLHPYEHLQIPHSNYMSNMILHNYVQLIQCDFNFLAYNFLHAITTFRNN